MTLQRLTIHNLASIEDGVIDFEAAPLADCDVFLISGKTGAGKSTILDAICLALYAKTPRLESTRMQGRVPDAGGEVAVDDVRQILRRNTGEGFSTLLFTGSDGMPYEATWAVKRSHGKPSGNLQGKSWSLTNLHSGATLTKDNEVRAGIQAAVGLTFDQFCRTTMLAQGEFTRFLNSRDDEKSEILEKITGVDIYTRIGARIFSLTREREAAYREARLRSEAVALLPDDEVQRMQAGQKELESDYAALAVEGKAVQDKLLWVKEALRLEQQAAAEQKEVDNGKMKMESELAKSDAAVLPLQELYARASALEQSRSQLKNAILQLQYLNAETQRQAGIEKNLAQTALQIKEHADRRRHAGEELQQATADRAAREAVILQLRDSVDKWAKSIRSTLREGDLCPVCRQRVGTLPREEELDALFAEADRQFKQADSHYRQLTDLCNRLDAELMALTKSQQQAQQQAEQSQHRIADLKAQVDCADEAALKKQLSTLNSQFSTLNSQIAQSKTIEQLRQNLQLRQSILDKTRQQQAVHWQSPLAVSIQDGEGSTLDAQLSILNSQLSILSARFRQLGERKGALAARLEKDAADRRALAALKAETDRRRNDFDRWSRLNALVGDATGKTFRTIAQSYVLANLIHSANHYMQMLSPRYRLRVTPGTFIISIEDAYQGYASRPATTISGGESFLVSLALALALSDIGQSFSVNILFIDEGFGSLSGQPLQRAIDTLRQLHTRSGRRVGIISHIEEMKESIPVQIQLLQEGPSATSTLKIVLEGDRGR